MATTTPGFTSARATRPQQLFTTVTDDQARLSFPSTTSANIAVNTLIGNVATVNSSNITINTTTLPGRITVSGNLNYSLTAHGTANLDPGAGAAAAAAVRVQWYDVSAQTNIGPVVNAGTAVTYSPTAANLIVAQAIPPVGQAWTYPAVLSNAVLEVAVIGAFITPSIS
jgi:hypothetical protein